MNYNYYIPKEVHFKNAIQAIWQVAYLTSFDKEYIIPKGVVEIIFNFSDSASILTQSGKTGWQLPTCFINGFNKSPLQLKLPKQQVFFGILLQPLTVKKILGSPAAEFSDSTIDLTLLDPAFHSLWHQLAEQDNFNSRVSIFLRWIERRLTDCEPREHFINDFLYAVNRHDVSVKELAGSVCYSTRHLSRKIVEATGMNTEEMLLYKKYLQAVHLIHHTDLSLTAIAYQSQFSDQAHFIKSFKAYTNMTPGEYRRDKSEVKGHLYKDVR